MKPRDICLAACPPLFWVIGLTAAKPAVAHFPPIFMMTMVYALTAVALFWTRKPRRTPLWAIFVIAAIGSAIQNALLFTGLTQLPASTAMLVVQTQVPFAVLAAWVIGKEQLSLGRWIGIVIAFAGVALVIGAPEASSAYLSLAFVVLAGLLWAVSQAMIRVFSRDDGRTLTVALCLFAAPQSLIISLLLEDGQWASLQSASLESWGAFGLDGAVRLHFRLHDLVPPARPFPDRSGDAISLAHAPAGCGGGSPVPGRAHLTGCHRGRRGYHSRIGRDRADARVAGRGCRGDLNYLP